MKQSTREDYAGKVRTAQLWLDAHYAEPVTPAQLARLVHISPFHFHRVFRGVSGESVMQCLRRRRLEAAALQLRRGATSVTRIALDVGFQSHEGFTRAFKEHFGVPPTEWRHSQSNRLSRATRAGIQAPAEVTRRRLVETPIVCMRHQGSFSDVPSAWQQFLHLASKQRLYSGAERMMGIYPDDPEVTRPGKVRFDVGLVGAPSSAPTAPLRVDLIPAGSWAVTVHHGSYDSLSETYLKLVGGWFPSRGVPLGALPCLEFYLNSPHSTPVAELRTEVWAPIAC